MSKLIKYKDIEVETASTSLLWILIFLVIASTVLFVIGLMIGYGILHSPFGIFSPETWQHVIDLTGGL